MFRKVVFVKQDGIVDFSLMGFFSRILQIISTVCCHSRLSRKIHCVVQADNKRAFLKWTENAYINKIRTNQGEILFHPRSFLSLPRLFICCSWPASPIISLLGLGVQGQADVVLELELGLGVVGTRHKLHLEVLFDGEHAVVLEVLGLGVEDLCRDRLVAGRLDLGELERALYHEKTWVKKTYNQVDVRRAPGVAVHQVQQLAGRTIVGHRVRRRPQAVEAVAAVGVRHKLATQVMLLLCWVLLLI
jgi:hypothetical protein